MKGTSSRRRVVVIGWLRHLGFDAGRIAAEEFTWVSLHAAGLCRVESAVRGADPDDARAALRPARTDNRERQSEADR
jgi:hypothetical protein